MLHYVIFCFIVYSCTPIQFSCIYNDISIPYPYSFSVASGTSWIHQKKKCKLNFLDASIYNFTFIRNDRGQSSISAMKWSKVVCSRTWALVFSSYVQGYIWSDVHTSYLRLFKCSSTYCISLHLLKRRLGCTLKHSNVSRVLSKYALTEHWVAFLPQPGDC